MHFYLLHGIENGNEIYHVIIAGDDDTARRSCQENFPGIVTIELLYCEKLDWNNLPYLEFSEGYCLLVIRNREEFKIEPDTILARFESPIDLILLPRTYRYEALFQCRIVEKYALQCRARSPDHTPDTDLYYCTDGGLVALCKKHLPDCQVVVWDGNQPMTKKYYDEVCSKA